MEKKGYNPKDTGFFNVAEGLRVMNKEDYLAEKAKERKTEAGPEAAPPDPEAVRQEQVIEETAARLREANLMLENAQRLSHEGQVTSFALPGESAAEAATKAANEFAKRILPLEAEIKNLQAKLGSLQDGLEAYRSAKEPN